jgi:hypothetical protein
MTQTKALRLALEALEFDSFYGTGKQEAITAIKAALLSRSDGEAKDEPVALKMDVIVVNLVREGINKHRARELAEHFIKHTTTPPQRKPLTDEEIVETFCKAPHQTQHVAWFAAGVRYAEATHGIKGESA